MIYEFEGKTEREAIELAAAQLGLETDEFDVEILESQAGGLFKKGKVRISVLTHETRAKEAVERPREPAPAKAKVEREEERVGAILESGPEPMDDFEEKMVEWTEQVVTLMGYPAKASVLFRERGKLGIKIETDNTSMVIGKKGKNIDSIQLLANVYAGKLGRNDVKVILDSENYRIRREESLVRLAYESAEQVRRTGRSILLEPMNPFERRIIHTSLNDIVDIETKSEGEGLYKQVRVMFRGRK